MKTTKHTQGPWKWDIRCEPNNPSRFTNREHSYLYDDKGNCLLEVTPECLPNKANAALIAAAPEMLEALELALAELERIKKGNESHESNCVSELALGMAEEIIRKARGQ